ncbi:PepSY domain-containing protein [Alloalcanivorax mobilis]|uniref:PepSY domain-containing protein n=1 Tax=Alloalcanivorax mobilis TaxID=2019569 RepID=UPI000C784C13|nr:PepSY domain-containing protein [Alloalcanivorax mobilis]
MMELGRGAAIASLLLLNSGATHALDISQDEALQLRRQGEILSFEAILKVAMQRYPDGRLLETELEQEGERLIYEIELLTGDGVVREMEIDARDASVLRDELDD